MSDSISLTREALYAKVWTSPITHIAKRLGLSDRGLAKLCARHDIPVPPRGWWAKKAAGHRLSQPKLPKADQPHTQSIWFKRRSEVALAEDAATPDVHPLIAFEQ